MSEKVESTVSKNQPELFFGLVGPVGVDIDAVVENLKITLEDMGYEPVVIHLTELLEAAISRVQKSSKHTTDHQLTRDETQLSSKISSGNLFRKQVGNGAALAALGVMDIQSKRDDPTVAQPNKAYIIRQLKTVEEILLLNNIYGPKFIQISINSDNEICHRNLIDRIYKEKPSFSRAECDIEARKLMSVDQKEEENKYGQRVSKIFYLGDVFIDGSSRKTIERDIKRFIMAFFGHNSISPTYDEYGSYMAASAALRSIDLSRQVGAAIFTKYGTIISLGSNEVPKFGGGTYWGSDRHAARDYDIHQERNKDEKDRITKDILKIILSLEDVECSKNIEEILSNPKSNREIEKALIGDITEYGRMVHAEMNAITDAARDGRSLRDATMYATTFPCHNCAKHIVASGIRRVVFIEPYAKSKAPEAHRDSISIDRPDGDKVHFDTFVGISPRRFRDIFEKGSRRNKSGQISEWYEEFPKPRIKHDDEGYLRNEFIETNSILPDEILD